MGISLLRQMLFVFAKVCVGDFKKPFCKSCGYSRLKITAKRLFQNASSVKLQQKGTKKQPNVRLFGEFQHFPFTSDAVCFCKSLRWRLQKTVLQVVRIQSLEDYGKAPFSKRFKCQIATKGYKKTAECSAVW